MSPRDCGCLENFRTRPGDGEPAFSGCARGRGAALWFRCAQDVLEVPLANRRAGWRSESAEESELGRRHLRLLPLGPRRVSGRDESQSHRGILHDQERAAEGRRVDGSRHGVFGRTHVGAHLRALPRISESAGFLGADHLLRVDQQRVRPARQDLPILPHVPDRGRRG